MSFFYTKSQRPTHVQALPTTKVDFLAIKVVLAITRTTTVFRNATDDFRTECVFYLNCQSSGNQYECTPAAARLARGTVWNFPETT